MRKGNSILASTSEGTAYIEQSFFYGFKELGQLSTFKRHFWQNVPHHFPKSFCLKSQITRTAKLGQISCFSLSCSVFKRASRLACSRATVTSSPRRLSSVFIARCSLLSSASNASLWASRAAFLCSASQAAFFFFRSAWRFSRSARFFFSCSSRRRTAALPLSEVCQRV